MTKVQIRFRLEGSVNEAVLECIAEAHTIYGIQHVRLSPAQDEVTVEYDATRLRPSEVRAALASGGVPIDVPV